jgi:enamine deaminase RidA (YjgF/YER057c/UK114 family)
MDKDARFRGLGDELPGRAASVFEDLAGYAAGARPVAAAGDLLVGQALPTQDGRLRWRGKLGRELTVDQGYAAARRAAINLLAGVREVLGTLDRLEYVVHLGGFIASAPSFTEQPRVLNGATDLFTEVLGADGDHTRGAIGCASLPGDAPVQLVAVFKTTPLSR